MHDAIIHVIWNNMHLLARVVEAHTTLPANFHSSLAFGEAILCVGFDLIWFDFIWFAFI